MSKDEASESPEGHGRLNHPSIASPRIGWAVLDHSPDGILICADDGRIVYASRAIEDIFGYPVESLVGETVECLLPASNRMAHRAHRETYSLQPSRRPMSAISPLWGVHRDGRKIPVDVALSPVADQNSGEGRWVMAAIRDITERQQLIAQNELFLRAIDATHDGVVVFNATTLEFTYANQGAATQTGYSSDELTAGLTPLDIGSGFNEHELRATLEPLLSGDATTRTLNIDWIHRSGSPAPIELTLEAPTLSASGSQPVVIALARDITSRRAAEAAERAAAAERERLERWSAILSDRERIARDLHDMVIQRLFAAGMQLQSATTRTDSDELRDPLDRVIGELDDVIAEIRSSIFQLQQRAGQPTLSERLDEIAARHQPTTTPRAQIEVETSEHVTDLATVEGLAACAEEAVSNSVRHGTPATIRVAVDRRGDDLVLEVRDDGVGIPDVYEPGNGIANLTARAAALGGHCRVERADTGGTRVAVTVPLPAHS